MKKVFIFALMALGLAMSSCVDSKLDPLSGNYLPAPTVVKFTKVDNSEAYKEDNRWNFVLDLSDNSSNTLHAVLIGNKYFLGSNSYTEAPEATAKNGNFIAGVTTINGKRVRQGTITIRENGTKYSLSAVLFAEDGTPFKAEWEGELVYEEPAVLEPQYTYADVIAADCTLEDGQTPVTDVESHTLTLKDLEGEFAAQIKLIRAAGTATSALAGVYTVKEYAHEDFSAGNGFDLGVYFGMAAGAYVIGSYYVSDGEVIIIEPGATINVSEMGDGVYTIDGDGFNFLCAPEGFVPGGGAVYDMEDTIAQDCTLEDGQTLVEDVESHTLVMKDDAGTFVAQMKLIRTVGTTDLSGTYTVKEYAHEDFSAGNGFDLGVYFGMDPGAYVIGSYYIADGAVVIVEPGETIEVSKIADDTYKFVGSSDFEFTGKLKAGETPGPGPGPVEPDNVELTEFLSLTDYGVYGMKMVGLELGTSGFYYQAPDYQTSYTPSYPVDGQFLKLELYSEDGKIAAGTYVPSAANGTVNPGEFNLGADNGWGGFNGTSWFTVASGAATGVAVTDGTVEVSVAGNVYTIEVKTSAVNAKFVGKLSDEEEPAVELAEFLSLTDYGMYGMKMVGMELGTSGFHYQAPDYQTSFTPSYPVDGQFIKLELYSEDGKVAPGTYVPSAANGTVNPGEFNLGADNGWGGFNGTAWFTVASGAATGVAVTDGTVDVALDGDVYTIEIKTTAVNAKYVGKLSSGSEPAAGVITIDGDMSDWDDIEAFGSEATSRIREWKYASDAENVYFYIALRKNRVDSGRKLVIGFNTDNDEATGSLTDNNKMKGCEAIARNIIPFTNASGASELVLVMGADSGSEVVSSTGDSAAGAVTVWAVAGTEDISSDSSNAFVELSIPKAKLGLPAAGTTIQVGASYDYYFAGWQSVVLE